MSAPQINISDVASLARLTLTPDETAKFSAQLTQILGHMETLSQIEDQIPKDFFLGLQQAREGRTLLMEEALPRSACAGL